MPTFTRASVELRLIRAAAFAAVCVALSAAGHAVASGGTVPAWWALGAAWALVCTAAAVLAGRERSLAGITGALLGGQLVLHLLFDAGQHHAAGPAASLGGMTGMPGMHGGSDAMSTAVPASSVAPGHSMGAMLWACEPMLLGHILAALALGWFLSCGETALWRLVRLAARAAAVSALPLRLALALVRVLVHGLFAPLRRWTRAAHGAERAGLTSVLLQHCVVLRGPPAAALPA